jgi:HSP20 family protein
MKRAPKSANVVVLDTEDPIIAENEALQEKIRYRAWELSHTRPHDAHALYDWLKAQSEMLSVPPVRIVEKDNMFDIQFAVAGVDPNDVKVIVTPSRVLLKAESAEEEVSEDGRVHISDFRTATIFRLVDLPESIDVKTVKVEYEDGVIHITAAKGGGAGERIEAPKAGAKENAADGPTKRAASSRKTPAKKSRAKLP